MNNISRGGFDRLHLSLEPDCCWSAEIPGEINLKVHQNSFRHGMLTHGMVCWKWIYETTDSDYLMCVENDVRFAPSAAARLHALIDREASNPLGFISLFTPNTSIYNEVSLSAIADGWVDHRAGYFATAGQCLCVRRDILGSLFTGFDFLPTDWYIGRYCKDKGLPCWHAYPSLAEHVAAYSTRLGMVWDDHKGYGYCDDA